MNRIGRMILMTSAQDRTRRDYPTTEYDGPDSRFRDRRGREHYDNGRFAPQNDGGTWVDSRYWDDREAYRPMESRYPMTTPYVQPVYRDRSGEEGGMRPVNRIGFRVSGDMDRIPPEFGREYRTDAGHRQMDEMSYRQGDGRMSGHGSGSGGQPFTRELAQEWVHSMKNADGTTGPHWTEDQAKQMMEQKGISGPPLEFWVALNATYSDLCKVFQKHGINNIDAYIDFAKEFWLNDKDSVPDKLAAYYNAVAKH